MPPETAAAIAWAMSQTLPDGSNVSAATHHDLVEKVREYFNANGIQYQTFGYEDLKPFLT